MFLALAEVRVSVITIGMLYCLYQHNGPHFLKQLGEFHRTLVIRRVTTFQLSNHVFYRAGTLLSPWIQKQLSSFPCWQHSVSILAQLYYLTPLMFLNT